MESLLVALVDRPDDPTTHLQQDVAGDAWSCRMVAEDDDFDNIRDDPRFRDLTEGA